ncbi:unnamed protein product [Phyllotreta striolata]|uniref:3-hydroxyacyl-CoA dehydrogenase n=1 Tax=Phyllotreta striolata TaxID=444603 RepID=A0A9N9TX72_PHYSR|nr:unnamed protein product [Phyllotreta striolata]
MKRITGNVIKRKLSTSTILNNSIKNVTVLGGGSMGSGIAQITAQAGQNTILVDISPDCLKNSEKTIQSSLTRVAKKLYKTDETSGKKFIDESLSRIKYSTNLQQAAEQTDLIIEAVTENLRLKRDLFKRLDKSAPSKTLFASNTSSFSIEEIASATDRKDRFGGLHFFNPVPVMKLLEIIRTRETTEETYQIMLNFGRSLGKTCITCKDSPGFIMNRLNVPYVAEAMRMLERGDATAEDIDTAMKLGAGYPMGPLEAVDYGGLDTCAFVLEGWHAKFPENKLFKPPAVLLRLVEEGKLGRKTGEGFYKYAKC